MSDAKTYLKKIMIYDAHINNKVSEIERLKAMVQKITATWKDDVVGGGYWSQDKVGDAVARIIDLQRTGGVPVLRRKGSK